MSNYETVIGLEVHVELRTKTKAFCNCLNIFGSEPNTNVCPVCLGLPGVLPVLNETVLEYAIRTGLALNCEIAQFSKFDRKNYYYPDLPKSYQISQYDLPICINGYLEIEIAGQKKRIRINRIHIEEDAGKLLHVIRENEGFSLVDLNRAGVPLLEIVTMPDIRSPEEARLYLEKLKTILEYLDISDCKMEEGSLRCDANISIRPEGAEYFNPKAEVKNMNSFRAVFRALSGEIDRQIQVMESGGRVAQETRAWDDSKGTTFSMRSKEEAADYRYFPEPDLVPIIVDRKHVEEIKNELPELPDAKKQRFEEEYGLPAYDAGVLTNSRRLAAYYEECVRRFNKPKVVSNWVMGEFLRLVNELGMDLLQVKVTPEHLAEMLSLLDQKVISGKIAKTVFEEMFTTGKTAKTVIEEQGLIQISDQDFLSQAVEEVLKANPAVVEDYLKGKKKALGFLVGQVMKNTQGKANPQLVNSIIMEKVGSL